MNVLVYSFRYDSPTKLAAFERTVHDYEKQSTNTVHDDIKKGVTMLGMEDMRAKEHLIRNSVRIHKLESRCERRFPRSREHNSTSTVNRCQCSSERNRRAKARANTAKAKAKTRTSRAKTRPLIQKTNRPRKQRATSQIKCFYCQKKGQVEAECRKRQKDLVDAEEKPVAERRNIHTTQQRRCRCGVYSQARDDTSTFVIAMHTCEH